MFQRKVAEYFDRLAPEWDQICTHDSRKIDLIMKYAGISSGCRVLDVACGTGVLFPFYLERGAKEITGVDLSPNMIARAKEKFDDPRITLVVGDAEKLEARNYYDCCVIYSALPHFEDPRRLFEAMSKKLAPNGRLTVAHSESKEKINQRHEGGASAVSFGLVPAEKLALMLAPYFLVDTLIDDDEMYVVSGIKK